MQPWVTRQAVGLYRYAIEGAESVQVAAGFVMLAPLESFTLSGLLVLDGVLMVGGGS